jgi:RND family efflux transporter MFP subunit
MWMRTSLVVVGLSAIAGPLLGQTNDVIKVERAFAELIFGVDVPAQVEGLLVKLNVDEGVAVRGESTLAVIDDRQARLNYELKLKQATVAKLEAESDVKIRNAEMTAKVEAKEEEIYRGMANKNVASQLEYEKESLQARQAKLSIELAQTQQGQAKAEYASKLAETELAQLEIGRREVVAPFGGTIEERYVQVGEWVQAGQKIVKLVSLEKLRVQGVVFVTEAPAYLLLGAPVTIELEMGEKVTEQFTGSVGFVSSIVERSDGRYRIWVDVENRKKNGDWVLKPGMSPKVTIRPKQDIARLNP